MSFYRSIALALAACVIASPVFAEEASITSTQETNTVKQSTNTNNATQNAVSTQQSASETTVSAEEAVKVSLNKSSTKELTKIKGVNPYKARQIVAYRKKHGDFKSLSELKSVKGFTKLNEDQLKEIQDQLSL